MLMNRFKNLLCPSIIGFQINTPVSTTPAMGRKIYRRCRGGAPWLASISANFRKNSKLSYCYFQGLGEDVHEKKIWSKKSHDTVPLYITKLTFNILQWLRARVRLAL